MQEKINLKDHIDFDFKPQPSWIPFMGTNWQLYLRPLKPEKNQELINAAREVVYNEIEMKRETKIGPDKYNELMAAWVIVDWTGLKTADLTQLVLCKHPETVIQYDTEVECTPEAKALLLKHSHVFSNWLARKCTDMAVFNEARIRETEKN